MVGNSFSFPFGAIWAYFQGLTNSQFVSVGVSILEDPFSGLAGSQTLLKILTSGGNTKYNTFRVRSESPG